MNESRDTRLGRLLARYEELRARDPSARIDVLKNEAGPDFGELVELATCLDWVARTHSVPVAGEQSRPAAKRTGGWRYGLWVMGAIAAAIPLLPTRKPPSPAVLEVRSVPGGLVTVDGAPIPASVSPGRHLLRITRRGFHPLEREVDVGSGERVSITENLRPIDAFSAAVLRTLAAEFQVSYDPLPDNLPPPFSKPLPDPDVSTLQPDEHERRALELELARLPEVWRSLPSGRLIVCTRLVRLAQYRAALLVANQLLDTAPSHRSPLVVALHALWGLRLTRHRTYAELHKRYLAADAD